MITPSSPRGRGSSVRIKRPSERRSLSRSATRALDILEYFGEARRPLRAIEIARKLGMTPSTVDQLLKTMVDSAHLVFDAFGKTYLPSPRLYGLSDWIVGSYPGAAQLDKLVQDVQTRTAMTITLTTPNDLFMQILYLAAPESLPTERGLRISLFGSAIGSAHLSTLSSKEVARLAQRARIDPADMPTISETMQTIRHDGFADGKTADGTIWSIGVPIAGEVLSIPLVLGLAGPPERVVQERGHLVQLMKAAIGYWLGDLDQQPSGPKRED